MIADFSSIIRIAPCYNNSMLLKNNTILVTGADGFIGSHLTEALARIVGKLGRCRIIIR
jgi:FlaA1/EpsC-like NDP-sugar epimerase